MRGRVIGFAVARLRVPVEHSATHLCDNLKTHKTILVPDNVKTGQKNNSDFSIDKSRCKPISHGDIETTKKNIYISVNSRSVTCVGL